MSLFFWNCKKIFEEYKDGKYNPAELLYYLCHTIKSYEFRHREMKILMFLIRDSVKNASWRDDPHIYDEWTRHTRFSFLAAYDKSPFWIIKDKISVDESPIITSYQPIDVANTILKHWDSLYEHPYLYTMITHLLEATTDLTTPHDFDVRVKSLIGRASALHDEALKKDQAEIKKMEEANIIMEYAYSLMGLDISKGRVQSPDEGL